MDVYIYICMYMYIHLCACVHEIYMCNIDIFMVEI